MITDLKLMFSVITLFLSLVFPIILAVWFCRKYKTSAVTVLLGALTFLVFQLLTRLPMLAVLRPIWPGSEVSKGGSRLFFYGLFLSVTAGLFEELGRVIIFELFLKRKGDWKNAAAFGIGHGGFESVVIVGITYINNLVIMILFRAGIIKIGSGTDPLSQVLQLIVDTPSYLFLIGGLERVFTITIHIGFSLLVVYGLVSKRYIFIFYSFLAHTLLNFPVIYSQLTPYGTLIMTAYIGLMALMSFIWISRISPRLFNNIKVDDAIENAG